MKLTYTFTRSDFRAAFRLHRRQKFGRRFAAPILILLAFSLFTLALISDPKSQMFAQCFAFGVGVLTWALLLPLLNLYQLEKAYRQHFPKARTSPETTSIIDEERIVGIVPGVSEASRTWQSIVEFAQDERVTLFYTTKSCFLILPTRVLSAEQRAELDAIVSRKGLRK